MMCWQRSFVSLSTLVLLSTAHASDNDRSWTGRLAANQGKIQERLTEAQVTALESRTFPMRPIGVFHSPLTPETGAPRQGRLAPTIHATIEVLPQYEECLNRLVGPFLL
jgi:hypothetical protein